MAKENIVAAHKFCSNNEGMLYNDKTCACFYCRGKRRGFRNKKIEAMHEYWF